VFAAQELYLVGPCRQEGATGFLQPCPPRAARGRRYFL